MYGEFFRHPDDVQLARLSPGLAGKRAVVQGLGNVGYHAAKFLATEDDVRVICVIERDGAVINADGRGALEIECDILIPPRWKARLRSTTPTIRFGRTGSKAGRNAHLAADRRTGCDDRASTA